MRKISSQSDTGKENLLEQLCGIFDDYGVDKENAFIQNALTHLSDRFEISEKDLYDFYIESVKLKKGVAI